MPKEVVFPDERYHDVLEKMVTYFEASPGVFAGILTGSLARGKAVDGSCIDLSVFIEKKMFERLAASLRSRVKAYSRLGGEVCYFQGEIEGGVEFGDIRVDLSFTDGKFHNGHMSFDIVRDEFETTIGNLLLHCVPLFEKGNRYQRLRSRYLPFYNDVLRKERLDGTNKEFSYKIWKTRWLASRGEHLAAFETLLETHRIFLQHLFIKERKYPIDYVKWLKEQCETILGMPELYPKMIAVVEGTKLDKKGIVNKVAMLEQLMQEYGTHQHLTNDSLS